MQPQEPPRLATAYLLLIVAGWFGMHRRYVGRRRSGDVMMWITLASVPLLLLGGIGLYGLYLVFFWMVFDLFALPFLMRPRVGKDWKG
jgi:hypothetical protein